jgi:MFS family permease
MNILKSPKDRQPRKKRPTGVTVVAILEVLGGISALAAANIVMSIFATMSGEGGGVTGRVASGFGILGGFFATVGGLIGAILFLVGVADFFIAYGLLKGSGWAWILCLVFAIIGIALGIILLPIGIVSIVADAVIAYYLTRPHVKQFFGKAASQ